MSPATDGPESPWTDELEPESRNADHFLNARKFLVAEGVLLIALAAAGFISQATHPAPGPFGAPVWFLSFTPWHSAILAVAGVAALLAVIRRRAAVIVTMVLIVVFVVLVFFGGVISAEQQPGPLGLQARDLLLHGAIALINVGILYWLLPDVLEGRDWVRRGKGNIAGEKDS